MSLEDRIVALTAAIEANTAALKGAGSTKGSTSTTKSETKGYEAKHTKTEMMAALTTVKEKFGAPAAREIVKTASGKEKMAEIEDPKAIDAAYEAAKAKIDAATSDDV